jgi:uncharacterized protein YqgV (UPF0045/DUF77 family)
MVKDINGTINKLHEVRMMLAAEVSIYPLKTGDGSAVITNSIEQLNGSGVNYSVGSISTFLRGSEEQVWGSLQEMFHTARARGEVSMVVTITNATD